MYSDGAGEGYLPSGDAGKFLPLYVEQGILPKDPSISIDVEGVGEMVRIATERGRATKPKLKLGICGEHNGDPTSIAFCEKVGLNYVSCSPFRVPVARRRRRWGWRATGRRDG